MRLCKLLILFFSLAVATAIGGQNTETSAPKNESFLTRLSDKGVTFPFSYTGEGLANLSGGYQTGAIYEGLVEAGLQLDLDKLVGWPGGSILVSAAYPHGDSLTEGWVQDLNCVSGIDAYDSIRLYEAWFQQNFAGDKVSIRLGQLLVDSEFFVSDYGSVFLNGAFGALPVISLNFSAPVFPIPTPGARLQVAFSESFAVQAGVYDGDVGDPASDDKHGVNWEFNSEEGVFGIVEMSFTANQHEESKGLRGTYKIGGFYHSGEFSDNADSAQCHCCNFGIYCIADQELWREKGSDDQGLGGFVRLSSSPDDRNCVSFYCDTGLSYKGIFPGRDKDILAVGFSYTKISEEMRDESGAPFDSHYEAILEATYQATITDWLSVQPDFQYIINPGATSSQQNAVIAGVRFNVNF